MFLFCFNIAFLLLEQKDSKTIAKEKQKDSKRKCIQSYNLLRIYLRLKYCLPGVSHCAPAEFIRLVLSSADIALALSRFIDSSIINCKKPAVNIIDLPAIHNLFISVYGRNE